ncbi:MAG: WecB/TagA/CpsF family glycosyltransferase [Gemmatimonadaceae bacterium]|nr:WecB/TagA/CpsF family glycosyltransferase [Chitinophagaceae bacterium]
MYSRMKILSLSVSEISFSDSVKEVAKLAALRKPSYVCFANVHMTIEAHQDPSFLEQVNGADFVLADGMPIATACRLLHNKKQDRISGMDFMPAILKVPGLRFFLYGSTQEVLDGLMASISDKYPGAVVSGAISPPFRKLSDEEQTVYINQINDSGANVVMVSLGCPKQEKWMATYSHRINSVLLGVGGAFHVTAGLQKRSPKWMQVAGLEWVFRLAQEPGRLFKRYLVTNSMFIWLLIKSLVKGKS